MNVVQMLPFLFCLRVRVVENILPFRICLRVVVLSARAVRPKRDASSFSLEILAETLKFSLKSEPLDTCSRRLARGCDEPNRLRPISFSRGKKNDHQKNRLICFIYGIRPANPYPHSIPLFNKFKETVVYVHHNFS
jgi:hypothetical protein